MSLGHAQGRSRQGTLRNFARTFVLFWALACRARAEAPPQNGGELDLAWQAANGCPDAAWAREALRDRLGREVQIGPDARLQVQTELARVGSEFQLRLVTKQNGQLGERTLSGRQCPSLAQTAVLVIALAITDLEAAAPSPPEEPTPPAPPPPAPPAPEEPAPPAPAPAPPATAEANPFSVRAAAMLDTGFLPRLGFGPELTLGFARGRLRVELSGFWLPSRESRPNDAGQVSVSLWALRPAACARLLDASLSIDFCLGAELGRASGEGSGLDSDRKRHWFHRGAWSGLQLSLRLGPDWVLSLTPGVSVPLGRPSFVSLATTEGAAAPEQTELHTPAAVSARVALGIGHSF